ncbi:protein containing Hemerythrin-like, metal-binding domain [Sulfurimonas gotlandica GD1]|uniref:Protein containing Hemerythrin-like, metal-binding domain n=1 Tax=Sulfurimonas gotlandica (strain DSM 19862 / JCM 16533 / GD1) TaxID=929558 RepID=B6BNP4_SULGG|nr:hemerythrin family protein [Sulfurimonas gotlandica]EDZ61176.1 non-heme iron protein, hemerythrin family [Sulfurimonas gotlandica GD1]EHP28847.1 protein containing Hemerythrin-like, metal-binding domain [Sulfurimonas gotlandica GD1]
MPSSQKIPWDDRYALGIDMIDTQHKKLFELVNRLYDLEDSKNVKEELRVILYEFNSYMQIHFEDEEAYMSVIDYPLLQEHKKLHEEIIESIKLVVVTPAKLGIIKSKMRVVAKRALIDHIMHEDTKIKLFLVEQEDEGIFDLSDL